MNNEFLIKIDSIEKVKEFCKICCNESFDIDVKADRYVVDGKSILGLFSIDITKELVCSCNSDLEQELLSFREKIEDYLVEEGHV